jgi:Cft2 family RNA processing exonuclease
LLLLAAAAAVLAAGEQVHQTVSCGGKVLIPVFAVGRAQELLLLLDEFWERTQLHVRKEEQQQQQDSTS